MYFPYFRGKQYELIALREMVDVISKSRKITPIIEPVKKNISALSKTLKEFKDRNLPFILVSNPQVGDFQSGRFQFKKDIINPILGGYDRYYLGYILSSTTQLVDIENFLKAYPSTNICLIHYHSFNNSTDLINLLREYENFKHNIFIEHKTTKTYRKHFGGFENVYIENSFSVQKSNKDYPEDESFSDQFSIYKDDGFFGFGDFTIVGDSYSETGGPAYVVAIHLTYLKEDDVIWIKHFISNVQGNSPVDPAGKFFDALEKSTEFLNCMPLKTEGCKGFLSLHSEKKYPGLGIVKKLSMKHHIELMSSILRESS